MLYAKTDRVASLLEEGADPNYCGRAFRAFYDGPHCMLALAATATAYTDQKAAEVGELLIKAGADVNMEFSKNGWTSLALAMSTERFQYAQLLIDHGADINAESHLGKREYGITPIYLLVHADSVKAMQFAIEKGADVNFKWKQWSPLLYALTAKKADKARLLIQSGATLEMSNQIIARKIERIRGYADKDTLSVIDLLAKQK